VLELSDDGMAIEPEQDNDQINDKEAKCKQEDYSDQPKKVGLRSEMSWKSSHSCFTGYHCRCGGY
jgi:hypothetical protein